MDIESRIKEVTEEINEILEKDDGKLIFVSYEKDTSTAVFKLTGIFDEDPMSMNTFRGGVERYLLSRVKEIRRIERIL